MTDTVKSPRKLIEVALPLDAINKAATREKSIRHGHPSTLHLWWARRPLAAARAVIFAQMVNDPSWKWEIENPGKIPPGHIKASWAAGRKRLFKIIEDLVQWENTTNENVLERARAEIWRSWREVCDLNKDHPQAEELFNPEKLPALHDPFCGGGTIPLEAQRLGLESHASDLNPVAVLITKAMIEIPVKFSRQIPVGPLYRDDALNTITLRNEWYGAKGLVEDVRRYGAWIWTEAKKHIGHLYPPIEITPEVIRERPDLKPLFGLKLTVIAWLWARTVKSPNPAFSHVSVPLAATFVLSSKAGKGAYIEPIVERNSYRFVVRTGTPPSNAKEGTKLARGSFRCILSNTPIPYGYIDSEANAGRMKAKLMALVCDGPRGRVYLAPDELSESVASSAIPNWKPNTPCRGTFASNAQGRIYGFKVFGDYFTPRQLIAMTTFSDLIGEVRKKIEIDAISAGMRDDNVGLDAGGTGAAAYAEAVTIYLAFAADRMANTLCTIARWTPDRQQTVTAFARQAIPMTWDFPEVNPFAGAAGDYRISVEGAVKGIPNIPGPLGFSTQADACTQIISRNKIISTDPPYYDNVAYADLSDFFYVWLRKAIGSVFPGIFATYAVPKAEELVASHYRHGSKQKAEQFFLVGMSAAMLRLAEQAHPAAPITIYYAFKQSETDKHSGTESTGWETFLEAVNRAGLQLSGTWPMRTELNNRPVSSGSNALASSIVLVCRRRPADAQTVSRRQFLHELNTVLPQAFDEMTKGSGNERSPVAPVDLSQAIIGPGMAVFTKYRAVLEADGSPMTVRTALQLINRFLAEDDLDADTQFCLHWFEQNGWKEGQYGDADTLSRAKGTSVDGMRSGGIVESGGA